MQSEQKYNKIESMLLEWRFFLLYETEFCYNL